MNSGVLFQLKEKLKLQTSDFLNPAPVAQQRIVSLVPSQTELLFHLGLEASVAGITKFCIHPESWFRSKTRIGGTKTPRIEQIRALNPTLVLANKEENRKEDIDELARFFPVYVSDISNLNDALNMIADVGELTGTREPAARIISGIETAFAALTPPEPALKTAYLIWHEPAMAAGNDTFIHDMMHRCGFSNVFAETARYPETHIEILRQLGCEVLLLSSEPFPFAEKHAAFYREQLPGVTVLLADGEMFSWYGSRLLEAPAYFRQLIALARQHR
ncbi:MAG: ABC transporter substrate-binding protein [Dinghuibacter sp.]|nr:ABC transporter substrate-binding protein [Dinghuibacter sp.]